MDEMCAEPLGSIPRTTRKKEGEKASESEKAREKDRKRKERKKKVLDPK